MKNYAAALALTALTLGCGVKKTDRDLNYPLETKEFVGNSSYTVVLIPDNHASYGCHANIYLTLESLVDDTKFVAREGRAGPTEHTNEDFQKYRYYDHKLRTKYYKDLIGLPFGQRKALARQWVEDRQYPSEYSFLRSWDAAMPMAAPVLFEAVYQDLVWTIGVEDKKALEKAEALTGPFSKADLRDPKNLKILIDDRNMHMVENIESYASAIKFGHLVPFVVGFHHLPDLKKRMEAKNISFRSIEHHPWCTSTDWMSFRWNNY